MNISLVTSSCLPDWILNQRGCCATESRSQIDAHDYTYETAPVTVFEELDSYARFIYANTHLRSIRSVKRSLPMSYRLQIANHKLVFESPRTVAGGASENAVEIRQALETAAETGFRYAALLPQ